MKQYLLPVWGHSRFAAAARDFGLPEGAWWDVPPMNYGHVLISYVHWKAPYKFPENSYVFGDSGGFSLRSETMADKLKLDPVAVLRWQESLCTVGCVLDLPPTGARRIWHKGLEKTIKHTQRALPVYEQLRAGGSKFRWWGVLHGNNESEVREYYETLSSVYPFADEGEGWAIRAEPHVNIYSVARSLRILKNLGIKKAHFLAATSQDVIAVLLALGPQAGLEVLTYDSAYAVKSGFNRHVFKPVTTGPAKGISFSILTEEGDGQEKQRDLGVTAVLSQEEREDFEKERPQKKDLSFRTGRDYLLNECECAVCAHMRVRSEETEKGRQQVKLDTFAGWWSTWLQFHDLHIQQKMTAAQAEVAEYDPNGLLQALLSKEDYSTVHRIFEEDGHEPGAIVQTGSSKSLLDYIK